MSAYGRLDFSNLSKSLVHTCEMRTDISIRKHLYVNWHEISTEKTHFLSCACVSFTGVRYTTDLAVNVMPIMQCCNLVPSAYVQLDWGRNEGSGSKVSCVHRNF